MRTILQRVTSARVTVDGETVGEIGSGLLALVGVERGDQLADVEVTAHKLQGVRVFEDVDGKMNRDPQQADAAFLVVSQFTLAASLAKGRRPSFDRAADPALAELLVEALVGRLRAAGLPVATGRFGAHMKVELVNDGPVTLVLDVRDGRVV